MGDVSRSVCVSEGDSGDLLVQSSESEPLLLKSAVKHGTVSIRELICIAVTASFFVSKETSNFHFLLLLKFIATWYLESDLGALPGMPGPCKKICSVKAAMKFWVMCEPSQGPRIDSQTIGSDCMFDK